MSVDEISFVRAFVCMPVSVCLCVCMSVCRCGYCFCHTDSKVFFRINWSSTDTALHCTPLFSNYKHTLTFVLLTSDVEALHDWHVEHCTAHPCYERVPDSVALETDPSVSLMITETEEGKKVARLGGKKYFAVFRRREEEELPPSRLFDLVTS